MSDLKPDTSQSRAEVFKHKKNLIAGLYAITPALNETSLLVDRVAAAIDGGVAIVQYRHKLASPALAEEQASALAKLCVRNKVAFIVNDDIDLARAVAADGVHLGKDDEDISIARSKLGSGTTIGVSCYNSLERAASAVESGADYIAFGSFFPSMTKPGAVRAQPALITEAKVRWKIPVVAIGGITARNAAPLIEAGADALAVITAIFEAEDIRAAASELSGVINAARRMK